MRAEKSLFFVALIVICRVYFTCSDHCLDELSVFGKPVHSQRFDLLASHFDAKPFQLRPTKSRYDFV